MSGTPVGWRSEGGSGRVGGMTRGWLAARRRAALYGIGRTLGMSEAVVDEVTGPVASRRDYLAARDALYRDLRTRLGGLGVPVEPAAREADQQTRDPR